MKSVVEAFVSSRKFSVFESKTVILQTNVANRILFPADFTGSTGFCGFR
jgi:hypothetical protein